MHPFCKRVLDIQQLFEVLPIKIVMKRRGIFDSTDEYESGSEYGTEEREGTCKYERINQDDVIRKAGFCSPELRKLVIQSMHKKNSITQSENPDIYITIISAATLRMRRIIEKSLNLANLRNMNSENSNLKVSDIPTIGFSLLNAEQNVENGIESDVTSPDPRVQKFVEELSVVQDQAVKIPKTLRRPPENILDLVPHNDRNPKITKADLLSVLSEEKGVRKAALLDYKYRQVINQEFNNTK